MGGGGGVVGVGGEIVGEGGGVVGGVVGVVGAGSGKECGGQTSSPNNHNFSNKGQPFFFKPKLFH